jgi:probable rRNA maturation factor
VRLAPHAARAIRASTLRAAGRAALHVAGAHHGASLAIVVAGDTALRRLNRDFLGINAPTDVLAFPAEGQGPGRSGSCEEYLGDVIISLARARAQARDGGHSLIDELRLLVIHGVLHLLGHDHDTPRHKARMWAAQARALRRLGASIDSPPG